MAAEAGPTEPLRLRVALVGCGRISAYHVAALTALRDVEIVAVCDVDEKSAREAATRHGIRGCYTDAVAMFRETRPDAVHLLTPPGSHLPLARLAAKYGAHMYIEQPFAATEAEARAILELAREAGVQVCPSHSRLFDPVFAEACRRIQAGEIGRVLSGTGTLLGIATGKVKRHQGLRTIIERFYQSLRDGLPPPVSPEEGVLNVRLMDQIKEAGKPFRKQRPELPLQQSAIRPRPGAGLTW